MSAKDDEDYLRAEKAESIWKCIVKIAAEEVGLPSSDVEAMLWDAGFHAFGHSGVVDAIETTKWLASRRTAQNGVRAKHA